MASIPLIPTVLIAAALVAPAPRQAPAADQGRPTVAGRSQTDQTLPVQKGARIDLTSCDGQVTVKVWDKDAVRVQASHASRTDVKVTPRDSVIVIDTNAMGATNFVDYDLTVPAWLALHIEGQACDVDVDGLSGAVSAHTVEGDINVHGVTGDVDARTVDGTIHLTGGRGKIHLSSIDQDITVSKTIGEMVLDSINGDLKLSDVQATALEASTVDGDIAFAGAFQPAGRYLFTTHDGDVILNIPESTSATFGVRAFSGAKPDTTLPLKATAAATGAATRGRRTVYTLGGGAAQVDIEQFDGTFYVRKPGEPAKKGKDKGKDKGANPTHLGGPRD